MKKVIMTLAFVIASPVAAFAADAPKSESCSCCKDMKDCACCHEEGKQAEHHDMQH